MAGHSGLLWSKSCTCRRHLALISVLFQWGCAGIWNASTSIFPRWRFRCRNVRMRGFCCRLPLRIPGIVARRKRYRQQVNQYCRLCHRNDNDRQCQLFLRECYYDHRGIQPCLLGFCYQREQEARRAWYDRNVHGARRKLLPPLLCTTCDNDFGCDDSKKKIE